MFSEAFSFIKFIPAPLTMRNLALPPFLRCNTIDNILSVVVQLTLGKLPLDSPLFVLLEVGSFLGWRMENFDSGRSRLCPIREHLEQFSFVRSPDGWLKVRGCGSVAFRLDTGVLLLD